MCVHVCVVGCQTAKGLIFATSATLHLHEFYFQQHSLNIQFGEKKAVKISTLITIPGPQDLTHQPGCLYALKTVHVLIKVVNRKKQKPVFALTHACNCVSLTVVCSFDTLSVFAVCSSVVILNSAGCSSVRLFG